MAQPKTTDTNDLAVIAQPGELAATQTQAQAIAFQQTPENIELLKKSLADAKTVLSDAELGIFLYQAQKTRLDPLSRQIYVMKRDQGGVSFMVSIDGQRLVAQRTGEYEGQTPTEWCGPDRIWKEVWLEDANPSAARVGVYRKGMPHPVYGVATWTSYAKMKDEWVNNQKTGNKYPTGVWATMPDVMLAKCAEALALRKAFPQELSGLYTPEEMNSTEAPEPPRTITARDALAEAGKALMDKGFDRDEALLVIAAIAEVEDASQLTGTKLGPVLEIVHRESAENLSLYLPGDQGDAGDEPEPEEPTPPAEAELVQAPTAPAQAPKTAESDLIGAATKSMLIGLFRKIPDGHAMDPLDYIAKLAGKPFEDIARGDVDRLTKKLKELAVVADEGDQG